MKCSEVDAWLQVSTGGLLTVRVNDLTEEGGREAGREGVKEEGVEERESEPVGRGIKAVCVCV